MTCLFCLGGEYKKLFVVSNLGGELVYFCFFSYYCLSVFLSTHAVMCLLSVSGKTGTFLSRPLPLLATSWLGVLDWDL